MPRQRLPIARRNWRGFTLTELMITVAIVSILAAIAYPSYMNQVRKSRRAEAKTLLLEAANRQEQFYATQTPNSYTNDMTALGYGADPQPSGDRGAGENWYTVTVNNPAGCNITNCFRLQATPVRDQANDTQCGTLSVTSLGQKAESGTGTVADCW